MALEASEVAVRLRLLGGSAFRAESDASAASLGRIGKAGKALNAQNGLGFFGGAASHARKLGTSLDTTGRKMQTFGRNWSLLVTAPIVATGYYAYKAANQFQQAMILLQTEAGASGKEIAFLTGQVHKLHGKYGFEDLDLAKSLYQIETAGYRGAKAMTVLTAAMMGARIGGDNVERSTNALVTILQNKFKDVSSAKQAMALIDAAVGAGRMYLPDLTAAMTTGTLQQVKLAGLGLKDFLAMTAAMTRAGVPSAQVANRARLTLTKLMHPTGKQPLADLAAMGLSQYQLATDLRSPAGLMGALSDLQAHLKGLPIDQQHGIMADLFGQSRGLANAAGLLQTLGVMKQIKSGVLDKTTQKTFNLHTQQAMSTGAAKQAVAMTGLHDSLIQLGTVLQPLVTKWLSELAHVVSDITKWFDGLSPSTQKWILRIAALAAVLGPLVLIGGSVVRVFGGFFSLIGWILPKLGLFTGATEAAGGAVEGLSMASFAGPLAAIGAVGFAFYEAYKHVKWFHDAVDALDHFLGGKGSKPISPNDIFGHGLSSPKFPKVLTVPRNPQAMARGQHAVGHWIPGNPYTDSHGVTHGALEKWSNTPAPLGGVLGALGDKIQVHSHIYLDGRKVADAVSRSQREQQNRR